MSSLASRGPLQTVNPHPLPQGGDVLRLLINLWLGDQVEYMFALKVPRPGDAVPAEEYLRLPRPQQFAQLAVGKRVVFSLLALAVRVLPAIEAALGIQQLPQDVIQGAAEDLPIEGAPGLLIGFGIGQRQQRVVVEHFLKMGDEPHFIGGVPGKAAAHMVEQAAAVHSLQSLFRHGQGPGIPGAPGIPDQKDQIVRGGEFGGAPKAAPAAVKALGIEASRPDDQRPVGPDGGAGLLRRLEPAGQRLSGGKQAVPGPSRHSSAAWCSRDSSAGLGRYVPAQKGFCSGVSSTVSGQPPEPVMAMQAAM